MEKLNKPIELRSEKVRNIIGQVPPVLLRHGILIICFSLLMLFLISTFLPFKETIPVLVKIELYPEEVSYSGNSCYGSTEITEENYNKIKIHDKILISINTDQIIEGTVSQMNSLSDSKNLIVSIELNNKIPPDRLTEGTILEGRIISYNTSIFKKIFSSFDRSK